MAIWRFVGSILFLTALIMMATGCYYPSIINEDVVRNLENEGKLPLKVCMMYSNTKFDVYRTRHKGWVNYKKKRKSHSFTVEVNLKNITNNVFFGNLAYQFDRIEFVDDYDNNALYDLIIKVSISDASSVNAKDVGHTAINAFIRYDIIIMDANNGNVEQFSIQSTFNQQFEFDLIRGAKYFSTIFKEFHRVMSDKYCNGYFQRKFQNTLTLNVV